MTLVLRSLVDGFDVTISSEKVLAQLEMADIYHAETTMKPMYLWAERCQDARDTGVFIRRMRDLDTVFMGCNIQNPYAGVVVGKTDSGNYTTWNANMFRGKFVEPLHTASVLQMPIGSLHAAQIAKIDWMKLEENRIEMDQEMQNASVGAGQSARKIYQSKVSIIDHPDLDQAALRGGAIAASRKSHNSTLSRMRWSEKRRTRWS